MVRNPGVARVFALHDAGQRKACGQLHGYILERMHGQVGAAFFECGFQLFDEQTFSAHFAQRTVQNLVALGGHAQERDLVALRSEQGLDVAGLPKGEAALTGGDGEMFQSCSLLVISGRAKGCTEC